MILLAEDNPVNQKLAVSMLSKGGYGVEVAENGIIAIEKFKANPQAFNLIFMDLQMPEMDGYEACRQIRALKLNDVPIIAMTANALRSDRERCLEAGMNDYVAKPIRRETVFKMIKKWILEPSLNTAICYQPISFNNSSSFRTAMPSERAFSTWSLRCHRRSRNQFFY